MDSHDFSKFPLYFKGHMHRCAAPNISTVQGNCERVYLLEESQST